MNRFDIINRIGDKYRVGNTETGEFSYAQALKTVGKDIKDYQKATTGTQHKFLDIRFENERLVVLVECKNKFSRWDKAKIQGQLQDYVRFEKAYSDKKIVAILAETDGDEVWVWFGQSVIIDDEHRMEEETVLRTFEEYENLCFGRVNDKIKVVDSIKTLNEKLHSDGINEKLRSQFVGTCLLALKNGLVYKNVKETLDPKTGKKLAPERVVLKSIKDILEGLLTRGGSLNKAGKLAVLNSKVLDDQDVTSLTYKELEDILQGNHGLLGKAGLTGGISQGSGKILRIHKRCNAGNVVRWRGRLEEHSGRQKAYGGSGNHGYAQPVRVYPLHA
jgi:type I restriction enzyme M protein